MWIEKKTVYWPNEKKALGKVELSTVTQTMIARYYLAQDEILAHLVETFGEEAANADPMPPAVAREYLRLTRAAAVRSAVVGMYTKDGDDWKEEEIPASVVEFERDLPAMLVIACRRVVDALNPGLYGIAASDDESAEKNDSAS